LEQVLQTGAIEMDLLEPQQTLEHWRKAYHLASAREAWLIHGPWIQKHQPEMGQAVAERFRFASTVSEAQAQAAWQQIAQIKARVREMVGQNGVVVVPSSASTALSMDADPAFIDDVRMRTMRITCVAGLSGLPQVSIPLSTKDDKPYGVSLLGPAGSDLALLRLAKRVAASLD
jgi:amidase